jgi:RNA polymerase sigma factor (sigma-70 family)
VGFSFINTSRADLDDLIADAQSHSHNDTAAMNEIVRRFEGLAQKLSRSISCPGYLLDDLANAARIALVSAVRHHDLRRQGFPGYAERYMRGAVLREIQKWTLPETVDSTMVEEIAAHASGTDRRCEEMFNRLAPWSTDRITDAISSLTPSQSDIAHMRYAEDQPLDTIATVTETTVSAVSQRLRTIHRRVELALAA